MSLCKLVVWDYLNNTPLECFSEGYTEGDLLLWREYVKNDLEEGTKRNWRYHFDNKDFLRCLDKLIRNLVPVAEVDASSGKPSGTSKLKI